MTSALCLRHDALGRLTLVGATSTAAVTPDGTACTSDGNVTSAQARFKYDASSRRIARWSQATNQWTYTISDASGNPLSELALVSGAWVKVRDYVWLDGRPLAQVEYPTPSTSYTYYLHADHIGLPRAMTNQAGQLVWNTQPRPYGDVVEKTATDPLSGRTVVTNLRLPGQYDERLVASLGLQGPHYNWNRWYLPGSGRYLELDPIALKGGFDGPFGPDWFSYVEGNPLSNVDPSGLDRYIECEGIKDPMLRKKCRDRIDEFCKRRTNSVACCKADLLTCKEDERKKRDNCPPYDEDTETDQLCLRKYRDCLIKAGVNP